MRRLLYGPVVLISISLALLTSCKGSGQNNSTGAQVVNLTPDEFANRMKEPGVVVLDVRTPGEFSGGHIPGAVNVDYSSGFETEVGKLDKSKTYLVYCQVGGRSGKATRYMVQNGFTQVYNLSGGMSAWKGNVEQ